MRAEVGGTRKNRRGNLNQDIICEENYFQAKGKIPKNKNLIIQILFLITAFSGIIDCYEKNFMKTLAWWEKGDNYFCNKFLVAQD